MKRTRSEELFTKAQQYFPGGVNSPVRAFRSVGGVPLFMEKGKGSHIWDADGNEFIDFCCSWGPLILGHSPAPVKAAIVEALESGTSFGTPTRRENELAELILNNNRFVEKIRFVSSGTEAVMSALRLARGYTGKTKIIKFDGCYHGHTDALLVKAGSGLVTLGTSSSAGVPESFAKETIVVGLDDEQAIKDVFAKWKDDIAAIIIEPIPANNGLLLQRKEFLEFLRTICTENKSLLIFDEVISGFRVGFEGAAGYYGIQPDIITYGKIIGGGLPVGCYGGKAEIMSCISPEGPVYQAGTLSGNPVAMAAGIAQLSELTKPGFYTELERKTNILTEALNSHAQKNALKYTVFSIGSIFWPAYTNTTAIRKAEDIDGASMQLFRVFYHELLTKGIYLGPSGYEVGFVSSAHSDEELKQAAATMIRALETSLKTEPQQAM